MMQSSRSGFRIAGTGVLLLVLAIQARSAEYEPMAVPADFHAARLELAVHDAARARDIPLRVYLPTNTAPAPVILFSHGLGGSRAGSSFLGEHWAARGYVVVFVQHPGSDESVWSDEPRRSRMKAMNQAASAENFLSRVRDIPAVLDQLEIWNADKTNQLAGRVEMKKVGMSGHSFGAVTTQAVSGQTSAIGGRQFTDPRIKAAIPFSPSTPRGGSAEKAFGSVSIPWMLMTGTRDISPIGQTDVKSRLGVYPALRGAPKYEVVLHEAEHSVFTDRPLPGDRATRNPNHHRAILALSTAFWDAYLRGDSAALAWLNEPGPRSVLEPDDRWQFSAP